MTDIIVVIFQKKQEVALKSDQRTSALVWGGLAMMGVQFGVLARLTWWEYSWDIMEPVTYFVTYGTTMALYAYFVLTNKVGVHARACVRYDNKILYVQDHLYIR